MDEREKQIDELAKTLHGGAGGEPCGKKIPCKKCILYSDKAGIYCACYIKAERLYKAGYRKQEECENISENHPVDEFICSECGLITRENSRIEIDEDADRDEAEYEFEFRFCPRCGRKVK